MDEKIEDKKFEDYIETSTFTVFEEDCYAILFGEDRKVTVHLKPNFQFELFGLLIPFFQIRYKIEKILEWKFTEDLTEIIFKFVKEDENE